MRSKRTTVHSEFKIQSALQIALALMLIGVAWLMWDARNHSRSFSSLQPITTNPRLAPMTVDRINRHMQLTEKKGELRSLAMQMENLELAPSPESALQSAPETHVMPPLRPPFESENLAAKVYRDTAPSANAYDTPYLPAERITALIEQEKWLERYNQQQIEAFIETLQQNARAAGYELEINENLQVTRVKKLRRPSSSR